MPPLPEKKLNILEYLTLKSSSVLLFFWLVISNVKLGVLLAIYHSNNGIFLLSCVAMESWTVAFLHGRAEMAVLQQTSSRNRRGKELCQF